MGSEENGNRSVFEKKNGVGVDPFYGSGWDPIGSLNQNGNFGNSCMDPNYAVMLENHIMGSGSSSHLVNFPSDPGLVSSLLPNVPTFGSGSFSEMVTSFGQSNFARNPEDGVFGASPNGKKKRKVPMGASVKNGEEKQQHGTAEFPEEDYEKKQNLEHNAGTNSGSDQTVKQAKDKSNGAEPSNENYVHIRAKRGQATNSHSLAERVRRERISERMRLLQELVPGCSKITGKAVMLDEIINYVQSLQQQVEFLSMKLATVNPEVNVDIERMLSKDILQSRGISSTALGNGLTSTPSHPFSGYLHGTFSQAPDTTSPFHPFPHNLRNNNELQSILQMGFDSNPRISSLGPNGMSNMEQ